MPGGRPRTSRASKKLHGTDRKDRRRPEPAPPPPSTGRIEPRKGLPRPVRTEFFRLVEACVQLGLPVRRSHSAILELTAGAICEYLAIQRKLAREGLSYRSKKGDGAVMYRKHPLVEVRGEVWRRAVTGLAKLGMTIADWKSVQPGTGPAPEDPTKPKDEDPFEEFDPR